jgi:flagellum-specific peptidoglycan hydrolase FlgJ
MKKGEFLEAASRAALSASRTSGFPPGITVAQAGLESAWGSSRLSRDAHNYFGIKAHGSGPWIENGTATRVRARFALYNSMQECFIDRDLLIQKNSCYRNARESAGHPENFIRALAVSWATDPLYADKILRVYRGNGLSELDHAFFTGRQNAPPEVQCRTNSE